MLSRGILSGGIAGDPTIIIAVDGIKVEVTVANGGIEAVNCDVTCIIGGIAIDLASAISLAPDTPRVVSATASKIDIVHAYFNQWIAPDSTYDVIFEAFFNGASVATLSLPSAVTFVKSAAEGELSNANVTVV